MAENDSIRLSKAAKELNISVGSIVEFLNSQKIPIDGSPNAKLSPELYALLLKQFQQDKKAKEESQQMLKEKAVRKEAVAPSAPTPAPTPVVSPIVEPPKPEPEPVAPEPIAVKPNAEPETPPAPLPPAEVVKEDVKVDDGVIRAKSDEDISVKVKGKIDLDALNSKTKPDKKGKKPAVTSKAEKAKPVEEAPPAVSASMVKQEAEVQSEPVKEKEAVAEVKAPEAPVDNVHVTQYEKLGGPVILGKMVLPVRDDKKKSGTDSGASASDGEKKKRKRIKKKGISGDMVSGASLETGRRPGVGSTSNYRPGNQNRGPRQEKAELTPEEIQNQIKETLARLSGSGKSKSSKLRRAKRDEASEKLQRDIEQREADKSTLKVTEFVSANELARMMNVSVNEIISTCMSLGMFVSINQRLSAETIVIVAEEFGYKVEFVTAEETVDVEEETDAPEDLKPRPPIVTVMGHVDHGKTSLLDYIRKANVIAGEAGGITQHIGAYGVTLENGKRITFLDTPGHEAFTAMRARGAQVTDVVIVVVAADDNVMPQTKEAINHAQAAGVPIVFAINKMDKPGANADKIREELSAINILVEEWGGKYQCQEVSAKKGTNIDLLLEKVLLEADLLDLKGNPAKNAVGTVIESSLDKGRGYVTTLLVQSGTLEVGDVVLAGCHSGRVKAMTNERGVAIKKAGPSTPVLLLGLSGAATAGDKFKVMDDEREAREIANRRMQLLREQGYRSQKHITLDEIGRRLAIGDFKELNIIVKGDVDGSIEALTDALLKLSTEKVQVNVIHKSVGQVTESDVLLASASNAIVVGFQVRPSANARKLAEQEQIDIRLYSIIYDAINEVKAAMEGLLAPEFEEKVVCNVQIRQVFKISKVGSIAGCMVMDGKITRNTKVRIIRDGIVVHTGTLGSLKRFKDDVKEVASGYECGLNIDGYNDIKEGDLIEGYEMVEIKKKL